MTEQKAIAATFTNSDKQFFRRHPARKTHIRLPYLDECSGEFRALGEHQRTRRRILLCRADAQGNFFPDGQIAKIPFLAFSDESIEDSDDVLLPIVNQIMEDAIRGAAR